MALYNLFFVLFTLAPAIILAKPHSLSPRQPIPSSSTSQQQSGTLTCYTSEPNTAQYYASSSTANGAIEDFCTYASGSFGPGSGKSDTQARRYAGLDLDNTSAYPVMITAQWAPSNREDESACPAFDFKTDGDTCRQVLQKIMDGCSSSDPQTALPVRGGVLQQDCMTWTMGVGPLIEAYTHWIPDLSS